MNPPLCQLFPWEKGRHPFRPTVGRRDVRDAKKTKEKTSIVIDNRNPHG